MRRGKKKISSGQRAAEWYQDMTDSLVTLILAWSCYQPVNGEPCLTCNSCKQER